ncbi:MAG TPA: hypothetical protein PK691_13300 [Thermomicrobiales bacterium]|nr:hypothetical protein [Thermomicrobiales bacterium]
MGRRSVVMGLGALGLIGGLGATQAMAQSTPEADDGDDRQPGERYQEFVANLATELGIDASAVDTGIRNSLKTAVDQDLAEGKISADAATKIKEHIDSSPSPLAAAMIANAHQHKGRRRRHKD